ncbi:DegT/DnrJ/EryC1/StrS family aminotransferase [Bradyrhizobium sp. WSM1743]|uniref:DegT/DnrJ/EryC1/StrS family aminotransferase n=1 Tax=Bradyrhizobium sp. WSM1743 TaxID=318996 RepID=UPI0004890E57
MVSTERAEYPLDGAHTVEENTSFIPLSDPDITFAELSAVETLLCSPQISNGRITEAFEQAFAAHLGRKYAVAVSSGTRRDAIIDDLRGAKVESAAYTQPPHLQHHYFDFGYRRGDFLVTEKIADRALALPFHPHLTNKQIEFIVETVKDASINVGAGAASY